MKINDLINEEYSESELRAAATKLYKLYSEVVSVKVAFAGDLNAAANQAKQLVKIAGRNTRDRGTSDWTSGKMYDNIMLTLVKLNRAKGVATPFPTGAGQTTSTFTKHLALHFSSLKAADRSWFARKWTMGSGGSYSDPTNGIEFRSEEDLNTAVEEIEKHSTKVYAQNPYNRKAPATYYKIGKFLLSTSTKVSGVFSSDPSTEYFILIQTTGILRNPLTAKVDITDQQAAGLSDIANTKSTAAMDKLKALVDVLRGEEDIKRIIANSKKITQGDKAKLDAIVAGSSSFKEQ